MCESLAATPSTGDPTDHIPILLSLDPAASKETVAEFLRQELDCPAIGSLYQYMHWIARRSGSHVDALHHNLVKGRQIIATEDAELHLLWLDKTMWIKPLPLWLLNPDFWEKYILPLGKCGRNATGFLRSYTRLIQHESDFLLALENRLIPQGSITYAEFRRLTKPFANEADSAVSPRYHFGQIRLSRLNWLLRIVQPSYRRGSGYLGRLYYHQLHWDTTDLVQASLAPFAFVFATVSVILSSMQVMLAAEGMGRSTWGSFAETSWVFSVAVLFGIVAFLVIMLLIVGIALCSQLFWSLKQHKTVKMDPSIRHVA